MERLQGVEERLSPVHPEILRAECQRQTHRFFIALPEERNEVTEVLIHVGQVLRNKRCNRRIAVLHVGRKSLQIRIVFAQQRSEAIAEGMIRLFCDEVQDFGIVIRLRIGQQRSFQIK